MANDLDTKVRKDVKTTRSLNFQLISRKGFLPDVGSSQLRSALKAELGRLQGTINQVLSECEQNGF